MKTPLYSFALCRGFCFVIWVCDEAGAKPNAAHQVVMLSKAKHLQTQKHSKI